MAGRPPFDVGGADGGAPAPAADAPTIRPGGTPPILAEIMSQTSSFLEQYGFMLLVLLLVALWAKPRIVEALRNRRTKAAIEAGTTSEEAMRLRDEMLRIREEQQRKFAEAAAQDAAAREDEDRERRISAFKTLQGNNVRPGHTLIDTNPLGGFRSGSTYRPAKKLGPSGCNTGS